MSGCSKTVPNWRAVYKTVATETARSHPRRSAIGKTAHFHFHKARRGRDTSLGDGPWESSTLTLRTVIDGTFEGDRLRGNRTGWRWRLREVLKRYSDWMPMLW
jgi:hypothetical protein